MNEIIIVDEDMQTISARELHEKLEIKTAFKDWFPRMCEYGFVECVDFNPLKKEQVRIEGDREVKREMMDYQLSMDMAKQICMIQRTAAGRQLRQYLIDLEKAWNTPEQIMARALKIADRQIESLWNMNNALSEDVNRMKPKEVFADAVAASHGSILIGELAKILRQNGIDTGEKRLFAWMRQEGYLIRRKGTDYNMPTQRSMEMKLFEVKETVISHADGHTSISKTTKVTGKGQQYFINKFLGKQELAVQE